MLDHQRDDFIITQFLFAKFELAIDRFTRAQKLARIEAHLFEQLAQFLFAQRLDVVVNFFEIDATLTEQLVQLATLGSSGFFVNSDSVGHRSVVSTGSGSDRVIMRETTRSLPLPVLLIYALYRSKP